MIFRDKNGFPVDQTKDGGDSAMRAGILGLFSMYFNQPPYENNQIWYENQGLMVRHPFDVPWNNSRNFTRDQMMCLISIMPKYVAKRVFWATIKRGFFSQNTERDYVGSKKYPWPHSFINDKGQKETRLFDWADPLFPHHVGHIALCTGSPWLYPLFLLGVPLLALSCIFNQGGEQNQLQCMVKVAGPWWVKFYKYCYRHWEMDTRRYWDSRNESEYAEMIIEGLK
jgi:hypothetical protein